MLGLASQLDYRYIPMKTGKNCAVQQADRLPPLYVVLCFTLYEKTDMISIDPHLLYV